MHTRTYALTYTMGACTHTNTHTYKEGVSSKYKEIERECQRVHRSRRKEKRSREERHFKSSQVGGNMKMMEWGHAI